MKERYVVDTNVLIAASAGDPQDPKDLDATPEDPSLRLKIFYWLDEFMPSSSHLVLDSVEKIYKEYRNKLNDQDFGIQLVIHKWSTSAVDSVSVEYDANGHGCLPGTLALTIHDREDRKMVAACLAALATHGPCVIAFAGDSDWIGWGRTLREHRVELEPVIEIWAHQKYGEKQKKKISRP
ncbi:MAG: hypothetical protein TE42_05045 [Candidatus Synechococcus spongiarum SP3]|uniref:PIN domain-containing protein n=1 Tax=Candidatus Synechococcus spongiarum SP3 TaxID=1604020 RepID=A0A0G2HM25_9SYNE|nr:MAG: hypothetical protein TE42_05045 [Candidatus Synechococcus spongiarum SP3]